MREEQGDLLQMVLDSEVQTDRALEVFRSAQTNLYCDGAITLEEFMDSLAHAERAQDQLGDYRTRIILGGDQA